MMLSSPLSRVVLFLSCTLVACVGSPDETSDSSDQSSTVSERALRESEVRRKVEIVEYELRTRFADAMIIVERELRFGASGTVLLHDGSGGRSTCAFRLTEAYGGETRAIPRLDKYLVIGPAIKASAVNDASLPRGAYVQATIPLANFVTRAGVRDAPADFVLECRVPSTITVEDLDRDLEAKGELDVRIRAPSR